MCILIYSCVHTHQYIIESARQTRRDARDASKPSNVGDARGRAVGLGQDNQCRNKKELVCDLTKQHSNTNQRNIHLTQSNIRKGIRRKGRGSFVRNSYVSTLCPVVMYGLTCALLRVVDGGREFREPGL